MNKINNFQAAVTLVCSLCDAKMKNEVYSISCRSHSMKLYNTLKYEWPIVELDEELRSEAKKPIVRMLELSK